jgi:hypothetical protein
LKSVLIFRHMRESPHIVKWNERPQPLFAKIESQPEYRSHVDRERCTAPCATRRLSDRLSGVSR